MSNSNPVLAVFPGQGSQFPGMGKELVETFALARHTFEEASDALKLDLKKLCFSSTESELALTANTQPALLVTSIAAYRVAKKETAVSPTLFAGHSLGEYSALVAAGALPLDLAVRMVRERGIAMQEAVPVGEGSMLALLGIEDEDARTLCRVATEKAEKARAGSAQSLSVRAWVEPANYNAPGQIVISGSIDALECATQLLQEGTVLPGKRIKAIRLAVSAPFHSALMGPARERLHRFFAPFESNWKQAVLAAPYIPNTTARITQEPQVIRELLEQQIDTAVLWKASMEAALNSLAPEQHLNLIEFGPGQVLQGLMKRIAKEGKGAQKLGQVIGCCSTQDLKGLEVFQ